MIDRSRMIRTASSLPVGDANRRDILSDIVLRGHAIRLAASLPKGSHARGEILRAIVAADETTESETKFEKLAKDNGLTSEDILDLTTYLVHSPVSTSQPASVLTGNFRSWWGGSFPVPWRDMDKGDLDKIVEAAVEVLPIAIATAARATAEGKGGKGKSKKASMARAANLVAVVAVAATIAHKAQEEKEQADYKRKRQREKEEQDSKYKPSSKPQPVKAYSAKKGETVDFDGPDAHSRARDFEYEEYKWATDLMGREPVAKDAWRSAQMKPSLEWRDMSSDFGDAAGDKKKLEAHNNVALLTSAVGHAYRSGKRGDELKKDVESAISDKTDRDLEWHKKTRRSIVNRKIDEHLGEELHRFVAEEKASAGFFEKMVGMIAPSWAEGKAVGRAQERQKGQEGKRTYEGYLEKKRDSGGKPITKEEWEARFGK